MKLIVMAGGSGTRLWPLSRTNYPKQFIKLSGMKKSVFQETISRCLLIGEQNDIYLVTSENYSELVNEQLKEMNVSIPYEQILLEPEAKNTLPAIMYAVQTIREKTDDICAVFSSDHIVDNPQALADTVKTAETLASSGFVTFGIKPDRPETGYGYIKPGNPLQGGFEVLEFKEKPDYDTAIRYVEQGYLWNSGIFVFQSEQFEDAVMNYNPEVYEAFRTSDIEESFDKTPSISVDYGLIEKMDNVYCVPLDAGWSDFGTFGTFCEKQHAKRDEADNVQFGDEIMLNSAKNIVYSEKNKAIALIGVSDLVVVDMDDALLICHKDQTQKVKDAVEILKKRGDSRVDDYIGKQ
ncbi:MAG: mannose-1-phosphate guanylyltransferase/mannose-6-phosphate isomerase [Oscillospiraceae bacterium]|jgi:mannose-1-phosphate guanylyltransferase/mannose-6-phosphate isomerase|nr:mannose-1-phosphate guanylyltransferase/mannose-6-phosphate isomerase [Oscillospiraceae bacterium]